MELELTDNERVAITFRDILEAQVIRPAVYGEIEDPDDRAIFEQAIVLARQEHDHDRAIQVEVPANRLKIVARYLQERAESFGIRSEISDDRPVPNYDPARPKEHINLRAQLLRAGHQAIVAFLDDPRNGIPRQT